jgi:ribosomal-protein-alanine N-acetyltransferase
MYLMSDRLILRPPRHEDWRTAHEWGAHPEVSRFQAWGPNTEEESEQFVLDAAATWNIPATSRTRLVWFAEHARHGVVGVGDLHIRSRTHRQAEISYLVHPKHWRRGHASEIAASMLDIAFGDLGMHRVFATCDPRNVASAAVLRKLGMRHEGRLRHTLELRDGWRDSEMFSILDTEWTGRPGGAMP